MIRVQVNRDRSLFASCDNLGTVGEHNATVLSFSFFEELNGEAVSGLEKKLVAVLDEGVIRYTLDGNFKLPKELTLSPELLLFIEIKKGESVLFKSYPHTFTLAETGEGGTGDVISAAVENAQNEYRTDLAASLETATGEDHSGKTWDELNGTVAGLPVLDEVKQEKIDGFDLVKFSVENTKIGRNGNYNIFTHGLFTTDPVDIAGHSVEFSLPYFNTSQAAWEYVGGTTGIRQNYFSSYLKEIGLDCTSAVNFATYKVTASIFEYMKKLKLTNVSCTLDGAFKRCTELNYLEIHGVDGTVKPMALTHTFYGCSSLIKVSGDEFDLSEIMDMASTFYGCYLFRGLKIKPFTLKCSIDLGDCRYLNVSAQTYPVTEDYSGIISLLNAIPEPEDNDNSNITITLNSGILDSFSTAYVLYDEETRLYSYNSAPDTVEAYIDLYGAFIIMKGVTVAWRD